MAPRLGDPRVAGREHVEQADQVEPAPCSALLTGRPPDDAEQPVEGLLDPAVGQVEVGDLDLRVHVVGALGRVTPRLRPGRRTVHPPEAGRPGPGPDLATGSSGMVSEHPLEGGRRAVEVAAFHGLLRGLDQPRVLVTARPSAASCRGSAPGPAAPGPPAAPPASVPPASAADGIPSCWAPASAGPSPWRTCASGARRGTPGTHLARDHGHHDRDALHLERARSAAGSRRRPPWRAPSDRSPPQRAFPESGLELLARTAPLGPQIHDNRDRARALDARRSRRWPRSRRTRGRVRRRARPARLPGTPAGRAARRPAAHRGRRRRKARNPAAAA